MEALPLASNCTVMFWHTAIGATLSSTVTTAVQLEVLPLASVTVSTTLLAPTLEQSKLETSMVVEAIPQASLEPPSTSAAVMEALPLASNCTVMFWHTAVGAILSSTITVDVQLALLPFTSVTVRVTVFGPISAQVKFSGLTEILAIPQLSELPPSISAALRIACPLESSCNVNGAAEVHT